MKLKYYLRGLGTGILFATVVLCIAYSYRLSDSQIKERAKELGMVYAGQEDDTSKDEASSEDANSGSEKNKESEKKQDDESAEDSTEDLTEESSTNESSSDTEVGQTEANENQSEIADEEEKQTYEVKVYGETISLDVAKELEEAGIIEDSVDFNQYLCNHGYSRIIQNGSVIVERGMTYEELAEILTN